MNVMEQILEKIKQYDRIMIFRHVRNDGDCVGASKGLKRILQLSFPEKEVLLIDSECAQYLAFMEQLETLDKPEGLTRGELQRTARNVLNFILKQMEYRNLFQEETE